MSVLYGLLTFVAVYGLGEAFRPQRMEGTDEQVSTGGLAVAAAALGLIVGFLS